MVFIYQMTTAGLVGASLILMIAILSVICHYKWKFTRIKTIVRNKIIFDKDLDRDTKFNQKSWKFWIANNKYGS